MKLIPKVLIASMLLASLVPARPAEDGGPAVTGRLGLAQYARAGGAYMPLKVGTMLQAGDVIQTANGSALDLDFGRNIGTIRLLESTTLAISNASPTDIQLNLRGGEILGQVRKQPPGSKFQIDVAGGITGIVGGEFRLNARGYLVVVEGSAVFVEVRLDGDPVAHTLIAIPAPIYYSPGEHAVRAAPKELEREVHSQIKARLPRK